MVGFILYFLSPSFFPSFLQSDSTLKGWVLFRTKDGVHKIGKLFKIKAVVSEEHKGCEGFSCINDAGYIPTDVQLYIGCYAQKKVREISYQQDRALERRL